MSVDRGEFRPEELSAARDGLTRLSELNPNTIRIARRIEDGISLDLVARTAPRDLGFSLQQLQAMEAAARKYGQGHQDWDVEGSLLLDLIREQMEAAMARQATSTSTLLNAPRMITRSVYPESYLAAYGEKGLEHIPQSGRGRWSDAGVYIRKMSPNLTMSELSSTNKAYTWEEVGYEIALIATGFAKEDGSNVSMLGVIEPNSLEVGTHPHQELPRSIAQFVEDTLPGGRDVVLVRGYYPNEGFNNWFHREPGRGWYREMVEKIGEITQELAQVEARVLAGPYPEGWLGKPQLFYLNDERRAIILGEIPPKYEKTFPVSQLPEIERVWRSSWF